MICDTKLIMSKKSDISLVNFFVFNPEFGPKEGEEHKKILFFHPPATDIDTKIKNVGLCEAITKFTGTFTDRPCQSLHTQKLRQLFYEPEPNYWVVLTVTVPYSTKTKDGQTYLEYHDEDVQDSVYEAVLHQCYKMFKSLEHFFSKYLITLKLGQSDMLDVFNGIHFLPLDKNMYLRIQCFINLLEATFPHILYTAFLYQDQLVWSGLEQEDMRVLYTYLTTNLFPAYMEQEFQGLKATSSSSSLTSLHSHYGKYILGPTNLADESSAGRIPRLYINKDQAVLECHLLVYKAHSASVCLVIDGNYGLMFDLFKRLDKFLGPQLSALASDIGDYYARKPQSSSESQFKYVYFNLMNLAQKTSIHTDSRKLAVTGVSPDVIKLISDLNEDLTSCHIQDGEMIIKTWNDCWVVCKKADQREVYIILNQKNANLIEINEEVKKLCASQFTNIFFMD
ncbi:hypothetical protein LSH36_339g00079 [Paralvinella palmiformis]|uniref:Vacuolar fusion protein CCZ1 homolog n=1 Tax=Paralvinella palmiformis TaxID=53620 RepID=A0AAD9JG90_9ANNE|nr:hypothetical protein LSH36_339g00079 [Paralvinella palmiformis]